VEIARFAEQLPRLWDDFPRSETPRGRRFDDLLAAIDGLGRENNLALLNLATSLLGPGESYVEVGSYRGRSLAAALRGNDVDAVGIDNWQMAGGDGRAELLANLARLQLPAPTLLEGDFRDVLSGGRLAGRRLGVYFYDAAHDFESQLDGLRLVEPYLADRALLIVDDSDWSGVAAATHAYLAEEPRARLLLEIGGEEHGAPHWWHGMHVLAFERVGPG
jgi:hypothetical protein